MALLELLQGSLMELSPSIVGGGGDGQKLGPDKLATVLDFLQHLIGAILHNEEAKRELYSLRLRPAFGHLVSVLLEIYSGATKEEAQARMAASRLLLALTGVGQRPHSCDALSLVLPGVFARCLKVALDSANAPGNGDIPRSAIRIISNIVASTMHDDCPTSPPAPKTNTPSDLTVQRTEEWLRMATAALQPQISLMAANLCTNSAWALRLELVEMLLTIKRNCSNAFTHNNRTPFTPMLVDVCVTMVGDSNDRVRRQIGMLLAELRRDSEEAVIIRHLSIKLGKAVKNLKERITNSPDGSGALQNVVNCLEVLGPEALGRLALASPDYLHQLLLAITSSTQVDIGRLMISAVGDGDREVSVAGMSHCERFFTALPLCHELKYAQISAIAGVLHDTQQVDGIVGWLSDRLRMVVDVCERTSTTLLIAAIINSSKIQEKGTDLTPMLYSFVGEALQYVLSPLDECLEAVVIDAKIEGTGRPHSQHFCLVAVTLSAVVLAMRRIAGERRADAQYHRLLIDTLYESLKWAASSNYLAKEAAEGALQDLAEASGCTDVSHLLASNASYVVYKLSLQSRYSTTTTHCSGRMPVVLGELLSRCSDGGMFDHVQHAVEELLVALDRSNQERTVLLMRAIRSYVRALRRWFPEGGPVDGQPSRTPPIKSAVAILNRTKHFLSSAHLPVQLLVMDILDEALMVVHRLENELLPMIHQNWQALVRKFDAPLTDSHKLVAARAVEVVGTMCRLSGTFIHLKVVDELRPKLITILQHSLKDLPLADRLYAQTASHRLLMAVINTAPTLVLQCGEWPEEYKQKMVEVLKRIIGASTRLESTIKRAAMGVLNEIK